MWRDLRSSATGARVILGASVYLGHAVGRHVVQFARHQDVDVVNIAGSNAELGQHGEAIPEGCRLLVVWSRSALQVPSLLPVYP
jgi:hypothetical protein